MKKVLFILSISLTACFFEGNEFKVKSYVSLGSLAGENQCRYYVSPIKEDGQIDGETFQFQDTCGKYKVGDVLGFKLVTKQK